MTVKHKLMTETYYSIVTGQTNYGLRGIRNSVLEVIRQFEFDDPNLVYTVLRDCEGDFEGVQVYMCSDEGKALAEAICKKYCVDFSDVSSDILKVTCN